MSNVENCVIGIKGQPKSTGYKVDVWFDSLNSVASLLCANNQHLLQKIFGNTSISISELSKQTGRAVSNVSRTLKHMQKYGIVTLEIKRNRVIPRSNYTNFIVVINNNER